MVPAGCLPSGTLGIGSSTHCCRPEYEDPKLALVEVTAAWEAEGTSGAVLVEGDEITGYLLGAPKASPVWGDNVWVEQAGQAVRDPETIRDLYAVAAAKWVADGKTAQYVLVPDDAELVDAWFRLGFGSQHAHAVRPVPPEPLADAGRSDRTAS